MNQIETFRDPALSLWQSALHAVISRHMPGQAARLSADNSLMLQANAVGRALDRTHPNPLATLGKAVLEPLASLATRLALAKFAKDEKLVALLADHFRFGNHDPLWAEALVEYERFLAARTAIPYRTYKSLDDFVLPLPAKDPLVIAVIADWGTGTAEAKEVLADVATRRPDLLIHLGDIYYSGTAQEVEENFYAPVHARLPDIPVFSLTGNHEMYSGGAAYYALLDRIGQPASFFCLRNAHWQLLALDTGLHDSDVFTVSGNLTYLEPAEARWHQHKLAGAGERKTVLLSHHQLFTAFGDGVGRDGDGRALAANPHLQASFVDRSQGLALEKVALWLWGHEHNLAVFDPYLGLARGRCVGAGAIPVQMAADPYAAKAGLAPPSGLSDLPRANRGIELASLGGYYNHCYAILTLAGPTAQVDYYQTSLGAGTGVLVFSETIA